MPPSNRRGRTKIITLTDSILRFTGATADKGVRAIAQQTASVTSRAVHQSDIMGAQQSINIILAQCKLSERHMRRLSRRHNRLVNTGQEAGTAEKIADWIVDHLLFVCDLLWGIVAPIVQQIYMVLIRVMLIVLVNVVFFWALYQLLTL